MLVNTWSLLMQERLVKASFFVHETYGAYRSIEDFWDGELWAICIFETLKNTLLLEQIYSALYPLVVVIQVRFWEVLLLMVTPNK